MPTPLVKPSTTEIVSVGGQYTIDTDAVRVNIRPYVYDATGTRIRINFETKPTAIEPRAFLATVANAGETLEQLLARAAASYFATLGIGKST